VKDLKDLEDYKRHIDNNCLPAFRRNLAKEFMEKDKEIERLNNDYLEMKDNFRVANDEIERLNSQLEEKTYLYNKLSTESKYTIEKLNNIITELEKYLEKERELDFNNKLCIEAILDKLKELKEGGTTNEESK